MLFLKRFGPATIGSAGTQIALFADTIIASFLATGALSALYYADRLNQLPIGVIGIAAGTVLLPEMARRITAGDEAGARHSQNRAIELTLLLSVPCLVAFLIVPELIMRGLFGRGAFTAADAHAAALTLMAYAIGLLPFVLMRSVTATFLSRGDTTTPVKALFVAVAVNVAAENPADGSLRPGRARLRDLGRRLDQSGAAGLVFRAPEFPRHRPAPAAVERQVRHRRRDSRRRAAARRAAGRGAVRGLDVVARRDDPACACRGRGDHLWHRHSGAVQPGMAGPDPGRRSDLRRKR